MIQALKEAKNQTGSRPSQFAFSPEVLKAIMTESMVAATQIFASTQKQTGYQGSPGSTIDEGALSGATAGAPRLNAARSLDYLQDGYLKKADKMDLR